VDEIPQCETSAKRTTNTEKKSVKKSNHTARAEVMTTHGNMRELPKPRGEQRRNFMPSAKIKLLQR